MNTMTATHVTNTTTEEKAPGIFSHSKKVLLNLTAYLTLLVVVYPVIFTALVFLELATTGNLANGISEAIL